LSEPPLPLVLVVNDAEEVRELTVAALEDGGYALFAASAARLGYRAHGPRTERGHSRGLRYGRRRRVVVFARGAAQRLISKPFASAHLVVALAGLRNIGQRHPTDAGRRIECHCMRRRRLLASVSRRGSASGLPPGDEQRRPVDLADLT